MDLGNGGSRLVAKVLNVKNPGTIEFLVDGEKTPFAVVPVENAGEITVDVNSDIKGVNNIMILFRGGDEELFDFDSWQLIR